MTILITGCGGYIGSRLAWTLLEQGKHVRGLDYDATHLQSLAALGIETIIADVTDRAALRAAVAGVSVVYHLAGSPLGSRDEVERTNIAGAQAIASVCGQGSGVRALVFASSGALYPSGPDWIDEETPPAPAFDYARAKYLAERELRVALAEDEVPAIIARIAGVYGPGSPALMLSMVQRGMFPLIGGGKGYISSIHVDDLITALLVLPEKGRLGRAYNLTDDEPTTVQQFYAHLAVLLGAPTPPSISPTLAQWLVRGASFVAQLRRRPSPLPDDLVAMAAVSHRMCNRRMREELGVVLRYPSYREGLPTCMPQAATHMYSDKKIC
ncbi:MAG: NAD-dependent epimerase/dehydratase family protein [Chloroflexales bacterium]|nr:NAD-dependent epimerase/dehydratase family protein [Chloroflexales bacterium]